MKHISEFSFISGGTIATAVLEHFRPLSWLTITVEVLTAIYTLLKIVECVQHITQNNKEKKS